jgi:hypothetical protein
MPSPGHLLLERVRPAQGRDRGRWRRRLRRPLRVGVTARFPVPLEDDTAGFLSSLGSAQARLSGTGAAVSYGRSRIRSSSG